MPPSEGSIRPLPDCGCILLADVLHTQSVGYVAQQAPHGDVSAGPDQLKPAGVGVAGKSMLSKLLTPAGIFFIACAIVILLLTVYFRIPMLRFFGFYEPDGFYHYSVIRAAVDHGLTVPHVLGISGWPVHSAVTEPDGLYWVTLIPYAMLSGFGVSYYTVERLIPLLFGVLDVVGVYFLARYLSKSKLLGLLAMLFVALSGGDEARTSALIYRGDGFVTIFLMIALVAFLEVFKSATWRRKLSFAVLSGFALSVSNLVWNGASFAVGVYVTAFFVVLAFAFVFARKEMIENLKYILLASFLWLALTSLYFAESWTVNQVFMGVQFLVLFVPMLLAWLVSYLLVAVPKYSGFLNSALLRLLFMAAAAVILVAAIVLSQGQLINNVFVNNGFTTTINSHVAKSSSTDFTSTIQELQPPTPGFLFASFGINIYSTLPSMAVMLSSYLPGTYTIMFIVIILCFVPYLFMQVYDSRGFLGGRARITFDINPGMLVLLSYFVLTAYLQIHAIRFNSLISVPIALLSAYTLYWLIAYAKTNAGSIKGHAAAVLFILFAGSGIWQQLSTVIPGTTASPVLQSLAVLFVTLAAVILLCLYAILRGRQRRLALGICLIAVTAIYLWFQLPVLQSYPVILWPALLMLLSVAVLVLVEYLFGIEAWYALALVFVIYAILYYNAIYTANLVQADQLNPQFFSALQWFKANTPANAVALTLWPDGSVVEGVANRTSVTDSVGSQNYTKADAFAVWLLNATPAPGFLTSNMTGYPGYLIARYPWMSETSGIFTEASADENISMQNFSYVKFSSFSENTNTSGTVYRFESPPLYNDIGIGALIDIRSVAAGHQVQGLLVTVNESSGRQISLLPMNSIIFYNLSGAASETAFVSNVPSDSSYTFLLNYSAIPRPGSPVNITGAAAVSPGLANSNMFKFLYLCGYSSCPWDNSRATLQLVYANTDTKIFRISYNSIT